jgi:hypothetical protein
VLAGNVDALVKQLQFQSVPCSPTPSGPIPAPPKCAVGEAAGTPVKVILVGTGESVWRRADDAAGLAESLRTWLGSSRHLYAVKRLRSTSELTGATYKIVFLTAARAGISLSLSDSGVVMYSFDPSFDPARQAEFPPGQFVLAPK